MLFMKRPLRLFSLWLMAMVAAPMAFAQYIPYFGKNKVNYDKFAWRVYKSPHFEVYYYPESEPSLEKVVSFAESAYDVLSREFDFQIDSLSFAESKVGDRFLAGAISIADADLARANARCRMATIW